MSCNREWSSMNVCASYEKCFFELRPSIRSVYMSNGSTFRYGWIIITIQFQRIETMSNCRMILHLTQLHAQLSIDFSVRNDGDVSSVLCLRTASSVKVIFAPHWEIFIDFFSSFPLKKNYYIIHTVLYAISHVCCGISTYILASLHQKPYSISIGFRCCISSIHNNNVYSILLIDCLFSLSLSHFRHNRNNIAIVSNKYARP